MIILGYSIRKQPIITAASGKLNIFPQVLFGYSIQVVKC